MNARLKMAYSEREELLDKLRRTEREHTGYENICFHFSFLFCHVGGPYNTSRYPMLNFDKVLPAVLALFNTVPKGVFLKSELHGQPDRSYLKIKC